MSACVRTPKASMRSEPTRTAPVGSRGRTRRWATTNGKAIANARVPPTSVCRGARSEAVLELLDSGALVRFTEESSAHLMVDIAVLTSIVNL